MELREQQFEEHEVAFIHILLDMKITEDQILGIMAMLNGNKSAMDKVVDFIRDNPKATESQIIKAASQAVGLKSANSRERKTCRCCKREFDIAELGLNGECSECRKTLNSKIREVHVAFDRSIHNSLYFGKREVPFELGVDYQKILLEYELCIGDISNPPFSNANAYAHKYSSAAESKKSIEKRIERLNDIPGDADAYLWINDLDINSYLNLCYFATLFKKFKNVFLVRAFSEDVEKENCEILDYLSNKRRLTHEDLDGFSLKIKSEDISGADYRVGIRDVIKPCNAAWLGEYALNNTGPKYKVVGQLFSDVYDNIKSDTGYIVSYDVVLSVINHLVLEGRLYSHGDYMWWGDSIHNNMLCTQRVRKYHSRNKRPLSKEDALSCVLDAFEVGLTYPLYAILDKDAALEFVDENKTVFGSRKIIEHIENDGTERVCVKRQNVFCEILKVAEGERYGIGEKCIRVIYEQENEGSCSHRIIKIKYDDAKISKIQVFIPYSPIRLEEDEDDFFESVR